jgi:methionine synthase I (cobalamin-dependent)
VRELFDRQLQDQTDAGGVDFWIGETFSYLGEALLFVERARRTGLPVMVTMCFEQAEPRSYEGDTPAEAAKQLAGAGADIVGVNCLNGPRWQLPIAVEMRGATDTYVATQPVAYRTDGERPDFTSTGAFPSDLDPLQLSRHDLAEFAQEANDAGIQYIGSCCGSVAAHVRAMAKVLGKLPEEEREWKSKGEKAMSAYEYYEHTETEVPK